MIYFIFSDGNNRFKRLYTENILIINQVKNTTTTFIGSARYGIDEKTRIFISTEYREKLSPEARKTFFVIPGVDTCLIAIPLNEWDKVLARLPYLDLAPLDLIRYQRWLLGNAVECPLDAQGRIRISQYLMEYAKLEKEVLVRGAGDWIELWNPEIYEKYEKEMGFDPQAAHAKLLAGKSFNSETSNAETAYSASQ